jgi:flavin-binding protein dodecin
MANGDLTGTSFDSFEDAAVNAMGQQQSNLERFDVVSQSIERGGFVGRVQYHVTLRRTS